MNFLRSFAAATLGFVPLAGNVPAADVALPVVPAGHPRLYLRAADVAKLPQCMAHPVLAPVLSKWRKMATQSPQARAEWEALNYWVRPRAVQ